MRIVIAGAGDIGSHLAQLMTYEDKDIVLIDKDPEILDLASSKLDILTIEGDATSIEKLKEAGTADARLFLAVTTSEQSNIISAILAKKMGAKLCIARVGNEEYLTEQNLSFFKQLGIDNLICPDKLAAEEINRLVHNFQFSDISTFEQDKISLIGFTIGPGSRLCNMALKNMSEHSDLEMVRIVAVIRDHQTIIPNGNTVIRNNDHVYIITDKEHCKTIDELTGEAKQNVKKIMILGDSPLAFLTAKALEKEYQVHIIGSDGEKCRIMADKLDSSTMVVKGSYRNIDFLESEGLAQKDMLIALTGNSETNIISCLSAKNRGVYKTLAQVENKEYTFISQDIGVDTLINTKLIAASEIFRYIRKGQVEAIKTLHGTDAELMQYVVRVENQLTKKPIKDINFPETAIIGIVMRGESFIIPTGECQLKLGDKVLLFALPDAIKKIEKLFTHK
jgi:trk system potassium uptake protein